MLWVANPLFVVGGKEGWMRKTSLTLAIAFGLLLTMAFPASAADLHDAHVGTDLKCPNDDIAVWHFVNNQTERSSSGVLMAMFSDGSMVVDNTPDKVNRNVQHWFIRGPEGELKSASTNLPGKLVLSDFECEKKD